MDLDLIGKTFKNKDLISIDQLTFQNIQLAFREAEKFSKNPNSNILKNKIVSLLFFEPSSRTFSSFDSSVKRLGGSTIEYQNPNETSSLKKGESFSDMIKIFDVYSDAIIIRHPEKGKAKEASEIANCPVINAGDGIGEHPSQALLDLFTIYKKTGKTQGLKGLIVGDLLNGRTVHSLLKILTLFKNNEVYLLSNKEFLLPDEELIQLKKKGLKINLIHSENEIPKNLDFWYWTRIQIERMKGRRISNSFILRNDLIEKYAGSKTIFLHPLPRVGEILEEVDSDKRALYLSDQIRNGVYVRMALLSLIL